MIIQAEWNAKLTDAAVLTMDSATATLHSFSSFFVRDHRLNAGKLIFIKQFYQ